MISIGEKEYEHELTGLFWTYKPKDEEDRKLYDLLNRICHANRDTKLYVTSKISQRLG